MKKTLTILIILIGILFIPALARADTGPKPTMKFKLVPAIDLMVSVTGGQQIECQDLACLTGKPLVEGGPQRFSCTKDSCSSLAYSYAPYHKLILDVNGKKIESNIFTTKGFNSNYTVNITSDKITVDSANSSLMVASEDLAVQTITALIITLFVELLLLLVIKLIFKLPWKILLACLIANLSSVPVLWLVTGWINISSIWILLAGEIIVVFYEALIYWLFLSKRFSYGKMIALSTVLNTASIFLAMFIRM